MAIGNSSNFMMSLIEVHMPNFAIIGSGAMGSAVAKRLIDHGAMVLTYLEGRSEQTIARAKAAGMVPVGRQELTKAELILSIVPPSEAIRGDGADGGGIFPAGHPWRAFEDFWQGGFTRYHRRLA